MISHRGSLLFCFIVTITVLSSSAAGFQQTPYWTEENGPVTLDGPGANSAAALDEIPESADKDTMNTLSDWTNILRNYGNPVCHRIPDNMTLCKNVGYQDMILPNYHQHESLDEVVQQSKVWINLANSHCNQDLAKLLCSLYAPVCIEGHLDRFILPCKHLCEEVKRDCFPKMLQFSFSWPDFLECDRFPDKSSGLCIEPSSQKTGSRCPGCTEEASYESTLSNYCTADIVLQSRIIGRYADERSGPDGGTVVTVQLAPRMKVMKQPRQRSNYLTRFRRQQQGFGPVQPPKFAKIDCDCPIMDAVFTNSLYANRRVYGRWLIMGKLSADGQTVLVDFITKMGRKNIEARRVLQQFHNNPDTCNAYKKQHNNQPASAASENSRQQIRRFVRREQGFEAPFGSGFQQQVREPRFIWRPKDPEQAFLNSRSNQQPQFSEQRKVLERINLHIPEIEMDKDLHSIDNSDSSGD